MMLGELSQLFRLHVAHVSFIDFPLWYVASGH
jgi:hypothetical protein